MEVSFIRLIQQIHWGLEISTTYMSTLTISILGVVLITRTDLDSRREMIIFELILTTFEMSNIF